MDLMSRVGRTYPDEVQTTMPQQMVRTYSSMQLLLRLFATITDCWVLPADDCVDGSSRRKPHIVGAAEPAWRAGPSAAGWAASVRNGIGRVGRWLDRLGAGACPVRGDAHVNCGQTFSCSTSDA